jgi:FixJ family two-component response regulator
MSEEPPVVFVIDDDASVRDAVADLVRSVGLRVEAFGSPQEFLHSERPDAPGCIVLDVRLPGPSGLEFQRTLTRSDIHLPIIFISGHGDIAMSVKAMKSGAIEFLTKPLPEQELLDAIQTGIERDRARRQEAKAVAELQRRFDSLTPREREVLALVAEGHTNRRIAASLQVSPATARNHVEHILRKLGVADRTQAAVKALELGLLVR